jgi:dsDNA-binding SOS-regulon protein
MAKVERFTKEGYESLIAAEYGNKKASKLGRSEGGFDPELYADQIAVIRTIAGKHNNLNASQVAKLATVIFEKNGWEMVSDARIAQIMAENMPLLTPGRRGQREWASTVAMQHKRKAPEFPTAFFSLDGWTVELLFQEGGEYSKRLVMVVVLDACGKYPVGYAIGDRENSELIRQANRNALLHLQELFGDRYRPYQVQSDRYSLKQLTPFYQALAHLHTPARVGNAKAKPIEPYFKHLNSTYCQFMPNWSGHNITARKENQVNTEWLDMIKKSFPDRAGVVRQIHAFMAEERRQKIDAYRAAWDAMPAEYRTTMTDRDWLMVFGQPMGETNRLSGKGIVKQYQLQEYVFDSFDPGFRANMHLAWQLFGDPDDLTKVLAISPDGKLQFVLEQKQAVSMDLLSATDDDHAYRSRIDQYNRDRRKEIMDTYAADGERMNRVLHQTPLALDNYQEAALKLMFTDQRGQQKEALQTAKGLRQIEAANAKEARQADADWQDIQRHYLETKTDFSQYLD